MPNVRRLLLTCALGLAGAMSPIPSGRAQSPTNLEPAPLPSPAPGNLPGASAADLLAQIAAFSPLPAGELRREVRHTFWTNRVRLALNFGALVGDGFLVVQARDRARVAPLGRELLRRARALGVGPALLARGQHFEELAEAGRWDELRVELTGAQGDVEAGLAGLRDEDLAMFVRLGGWLRGVECAGAATAERYSPARAAALARPAVVRQFVERLERLNPALREGLVVELTAGLREILGVLDRPAAEPVSAADARRVYEAARRLNALVAAPDDA